MVSPPEEGGTQEARDADNNIIISDLTLCNILPPQLKNMTSRYKVMCGCEYCVSSKSIHSSLLTWCDCHLKNLKDRSRNAQNTSSGYLKDILDQANKSVDVNKSDHPTGTLAMTSYKLVREANPYVRFGYFPQIIN